MADNSQESDSGADVGSDAGSDIPAGSPLSDIAREVLSEPRTKSAAKLKAKADEILDGASADEIPEEAPDDRDDIADEVGGQSDDAPKKVWKLKANGKEYDVDSEDKLVAAAQRGIASEQAWHKAQHEISELRSRMEATIRSAEEREELVKKDPAAFVRKFNDKAEDIMEQILLDRAKESMAMENMTHREKELYLQNKKYQQDIKQREEQEKESNAKQEHQLVEQQKRQIGDIFAKALTEAKLPTNNYTVRVMASVYRAAVSKGVELTVDQAAQMTKKHLSEVAEHFSPKIEEMQASDFVSKYPKLTESIRKHLVSQIKGRPSETSDVTRQARAKDGKFKQSNVPDSGKDWDKYIDRLKKEGNALNVKRSW